MLEIPMFYLSGTVFVLSRWAAVIFWSARWRFDGSNPIQIAWSNPADGGILAHSAHTQEVTPYRSPTWQNLERTWLLTLIHSVLSMYNWGSPKITVINRSAALFISPYNFCFWFDFWFTKLSAPCLICLIYQRTIPTMILVVCFSLCYYSEDLFVYFAKSLLFCWN